MALFMPSNVVPDQRSGLGLGVVDATQDMEVSWRIQGQSAMVAFRITIYQNNAASTQVFSTGKITTGCPAYGTTSSGEIQFFSYTIPAASLSSAGMVNGGSYKLVITQWWTANDYVTQSSASAFITRTAPTIAVNAVGTAGVIDTKEYTFTGAYSQSQGDVLNWFRWIIAYQNDKNNPIFDSGEISGTMDISCTYDGFFTGTSYSVWLGIQTENGVEIDTGWIDFDCNYAEPSGYESYINVSCDKNVDALILEWPGVSKEGTGDNVTVVDGIGASIGSSGYVEYSLYGFDDYSVITKARLQDADCTIFSVNSGEFTVDYDFSTQTLSYTNDGSTVTIATGVMGKESTVSIVATPTSIDVRIFTEGLYPSNTLYPSDTLYPRDDTTRYISQSLTWDQTAGIDTIQVIGVQINKYLEVIKGTASQSAINDVMNDTYLPPYTEAESYLFTTWNNGLYAETSWINGKPVTGYAIYRRLENESVITHIADFPVTTTKFYDYSVTNQNNKYIYYLFPMGTDTYLTDAIASDPISFCKWDYSLLECVKGDNDNQYECIASYRFRNNVSTGDFNNNNSPQILKNFTRYPTIQYTPQNYKSGSLTGLIGSVSHINGEVKYSDKISVREAIFALSTTENELFLRTRKGDLIKVKPSGPITVNTWDETKEQAQSLTFPWVEVGSTDGVSIYAVDPVDKIVPEQQVAVATVAATRTMLRNRAALKMPAFGF